MCAFDVHTSAPLTTQSPEALRVALVRIEAGSEPQSDSLVPITKKHSPRGGARQDRRALLLGATSQQIRTGLPVRDPVGRVNRHVLLGARHAQSAAVAEHPAKHRVQAGAPCVDAGREASSGELGSQELAHLHVYPFSGLGELRGRGRQERRAGHFDTLPSSRFSMMLTGEPVPDWDSTKGRSLLTWRLAEQVPVRAPGGQHLRSAARPANRGLPTARRRSAEHDGRPRSGRRTATAPARPAP